MTENPNQLTSSSSTSETGERLRTMLAATSFFLLLSSYYVLRPVRDDMAVRTGSDHVPWLFTATFACTLAVVPLFGWIVKVCSRTVLVPAVYGLMIVSLTGFFAIFSVGISNITAAAFFIWLSLFNLMVVSLFWSTVSDAFSTEEAKRRYGYITAGGTAGAILGPAITASIAEFVSTASLLLVSMGILSCSLVGLIALQRKTANPGSFIERPIGGSIFAGITQTMRSPLLASLTGLAICYSAVSTVLYLEMTSIVGKTLAEPGQRTAFFARIDLSVNLLALMIQLLATQRIVLQWGLRWSLSLVPAAMLFGMFVIGIWPSTAAYAVMQCINRAGEFSLSKPSREILYTTIDQESRYKAKNFIDTAVYRANDTASSWLISSIRAVGGNAVWYVALPATIIWLSLGRIIGQRYDFRSPQHDIEQQQSDQHV